MSQLSEEKILEKDGRRYIVHKDGNTLFIGTFDYFSNVAAQVLCHEIMKPLKWATTGTFSSLLLDGKICTGVGYSIPSNQELERSPLDYLATVF